MNRRWILTTSTILLIVTSIAIITPATQEQVHILTPADHIQTIIDTLNPGSTLLLTHGEYNQTFTLSKRINIIGQDPTRTIINVTTEQNKPAITIKEQNILISQLTIQNNGPGLYTTGIRILSNSTSIKNCIFKDTPIGISVWSNNNTIDNSTFYRCSDEGIVLLSTSFSTANNNTISSCVFENNCDAIELQQSCNNLIKDCIMTNNTHCGIDAIKKQNNYNHIMNCTITHNTVHGIYLTYSHENIIYDCRIGHNTDGDIITPHSTNTTIAFSQKTQVSTDENTSYPDTYQQKDIFIEKIQSLQKEHTILNSIITFIKTILSRIIQ